MEPFKNCPCCFQRWPTRQAFLGDPGLEIIGYQVNFAILELGLLLFNHSACCTTLAVPARHFTDLYSGPIFEERRTGREDCPGHCLRPDELRACAAPCECAYVRQILQIIRTWPKPEHLSQTVSCGENARRAAPGLVAERNPTGQAEE